MNNPEVEVSGVKFHIRRALELLYPNLPPKLLDRLAPSFADLIHRRLTPQEFYEIGMEEDDSVQWDKLRIMYGALLRVFDLPFAEGAA